MAKRQWCRIAAASGFHLLDLATHYSSQGQEGEANKYHSAGLDDIAEALRLAQEEHDGKPLSLDQKEKIVAELRRRDFDPEFIDSVAV